VSEHRSSGSPSARALKQAFDRTFAVERPTAPLPPIDFLSVRIGGDLHAFALSDIVELAPRGAVVALPGAPAACLGLAGLRGSVTPVYDLRILLGYGAGTASGTWLTVIADGSAALAFDDIEGRIRAPREALADAAEGQAARAHVRQLLTADDAVRAVIDTNSLIETIRKIAAGAPSNG
jgi:chemotaxis signal transduction protein